MKSFFRRYVVTFALVCLLVTGTASSAVTKGPAKVDDPTVPSSLYKSRREKLMNSIGPASVAIFYSSPLRMRNGDTEYPYRQNDDFYYLTGLNAPDLVLVLCPSGCRLPSGSDSSGDGKAREILLHDQSPVVGEVLTGETIRNRSAIDRALPVSMLRELVDAFVGSAEALFVPTFPADFSGDIARIMFPLREALTRINRRVVIKDPTPILAVMRTIKSPDEIALIRKAAEISVTAHTQAMMSVESGMSDFEICALLEYVFIRLGAESDAFPCIVSAGNDAVSLHPGLSRRKMNDGELLVIDAGAEYHNYAADVTRTIPVNGRFTDRQKEIYEIVLHAQEAAIQSIKAGVKIKAVERAAVDTIARGLVRVGLLSGDPDSLVACGACRKYMVHGMLHPVGLAVHDEVAVPEQLEAGMVLAVEPALYIPADPENQDGIAVRIEDTIVVTKDGFENLSADLPKGVEEVERLMKRRGLGNDPLD